MDCLSIEDENIGMKGVYTSPKKLKQLQGISKASDAPEDRKSVESKATEVREMENKVSEMRIQEDTLKAEILDLRAQEQELDEQVHICSLLLHMLPHVTHE